MGSDPELRVVRSRGPDRPDADVLMPRVARGGARGVGWIASLEKTVLRHRFAFTVGNLRATTVDQYIASDFRQARAGAPNFAPQDLYLGFNLVRQWSLK